MGTLKDGSKLSLGISAETHAKAVAKAKNEVDTKRLPLEDCALLFEKVALIRPSTDPKGDQVF